MVSVTDRNTYRTCWRFNKLYPDLQPLNSKKFLHKHKVIWSTTCQWGQRCEIYQNTWLQKSHIMNVLTHMSPSFISFRLYHHLGLSLIIKVWYTSVKLFWLLSKKILPLKKIKLCEKFFCMCLILNLLLLSVTYIPFAHICKKIFLVWIMTML